MPKTAVISMLAGASWFPVGTLFAFIPVVGPGFATCFFVMGTALIGIGALMGMLTDRRVWK